MRETFHPGQPESRSTLRAGRRALLRGAAAVLSSSCAGRLLLAGRAIASDDRGARAGASPVPLILRSAEPEALEFPFSTLDGFLTPNEQFYVLSHFGTPALDAGTWRLNVEGEVDRPLALDYEDLLKMPSRRKVALLECSGNGRVFLRPRVPGVPWEQGGVGNAEWTGVPLSDVLERAGVRERAVEVILEGSDRGERKDEPRSPGAIPFARALPIAKARRDVLLAYRMNGVDLPPKHGYPLRAIVPGWHGVASVKWLTRIVVASRPFRGYFQSLEYTYFERNHGLPSLVPVTEVGVKSQVARPGRGERIPRDTPYRIHGAAWAGEYDVAKVEVSTDGGASWSDAKLLGDPVRHAWRLWELPWRTPDRAGTHRLMSRATDSRGRVQPMGRDPDRRGYLINHVVPVEVEVN